MNFLLIPEENSNLETAKAVFLKVPYEQTVSYLSGTDKGPKNLEEASANVELFDEQYLVEPHIELGIATEEVTDLNDNHEESLRAIGKSFGKYFDMDKFVVAVGGEHSITIGIVDELADKKEDFSILQFDAHTDLRDEYEDDKLSHACVMRRASEKVDNIVQVGIRSISKDEHDYLIDSGQDKNVMWGQDLHLMTAEEIAEGILKRLTNDDIYISFDIDFFGLEIVRDTGTPEPGGLGWHKTLKVLEMIFSQKNVIGMDVVELIGEDDVSAFNAARLVKKCIVYKFFA